MKVLCLIALIIVGASATFDYTNCAKNSFQLYQSITAYVNTVQSGNFNIANLQQEINNLIDTSSAVIDNCPVPAQSIQNLPTVSGNCLNDLKTLTQICEKAVNDYEAKNIFALVGDAEAILKEAKQTLSDCKSAQIDATPKLLAPTPECQVSTVQYGIDLHRWIQLAKQNPTPQVWNDFLVSTSQLLTDTTGLLDKCGINFKDDGSITYSISAECTKDITLLTADVEKAIKAYDSGNIIGLVKDAVEIIKVANKTLQDCQSKELEESIEIALLNNPTINYEKCAKDAYNFVEACKKFVDDVQNGTDSHNLPLILSDIEGIVSSAQSLVVDCGFNSTFTAPFVNYQVSNFDIVDIPHCQEAVDRLVVDIPQLVALLEANNFQAFSIELGLFMNDIAKALNNCHSTFIDNLEIALSLNPSINYEKCAIDAYHFGQACYTFIEDVQNGTDSHNLPQILTDVQNIVTTAQALVTDCGLNLTEQSKVFLDFDASMINVANPITCAKDLETLTTDVQKAVKDYESKNIAALVKDAEQIIVVANKTLIDCKSTLPAFAEQQLPIQIQIDLETCFADKDKYIAQVQEFILFSMSGNLQDTAIAEQINNLIAISQNMLDGCGIQIDLSQIVPLNAGSCIGDLINVAQLAGATIKDMLTLQYQAAAVDLIGLISEASTALRDCVAEDSDSVANNIVFSCIHAADTFVTLIEQFQADYQKGDDFQVLVQDSGNIAQNIPVLLNTCGAGQAAAFYTKYLPDDCIVSLESTADAADKIYQVRNNFFEILRTLPVMADALESDLFTCPLLKPKFIRNN